MGCWLESVIKSFYFTIPVSYTHLDVYKRQSKHSGKSSQSKGQNYDSDDEEHQGAEGVQCASQ